MTKGLGELAGKKNDVADPLVVKGQGEKEPMSVYHVMHVNGCFRDFTGNIM